MNTQHRSIIIIVLLIVCIVVSFTFSKAKYEGSGFISSIKMPTITSNWQGTDVSEQLNILPDSDVFNFLSEAVSYEYVNKEGEKLLFIILDAGNFHHPKVCFTYAGYEIKELNDTVFHANGNSLMTHTLHTIKGNDNYVTFYWIIIDKNIAHQWIEQKVKQFYYSLFNRKRIGLMVRIDVPTREVNLKNSINIAQNFIDELNKSFKNDDSEYIFGKY